MTDKQKTQAFKQELKALLAKHNACIDVGYGIHSDTTGIYDEHLELEIQGCKPVRLVETWYMTSTDLQDTE